jgi:LuxR family transcriptional regulator, maltose regulon positive regulatory protein
MALVLDKLNVPVELPCVSRARLLAALEESMTCCTSTIVCGRAGTGKTLLATDFARRAGRRVAWYKVDAPEADLPVFIQYLVAAVRVQHPGFGRKTLALANESRDPRAAALVAESFVYEMTMLEASEPLLLVMDDLHLVYDADWFVPFFHRLLPLLPAEAHVLLLGRTLPPAPLWRLRSKQTLRVLDEAALLFTPAETAELLAHHNVAGDAATNVWTNTRGRAAALDLAARDLAARRRQGATLRAPQDAGARAAADERNPRAGLRLIKGLQKPLRAT